MTRLLVKLFVKNNGNTQAQKVRTSYGVLASVVGVICNFLLFIFKITISILINSISIMADAFNNLSDSASSMVSLFGVKLANRPADKEHPFGHGRFEYISALVVSFLILMVGVSLFKSSVEKVIHPEKLGFSWLMVSILILSVLVKVWLSLFNRNIGKKINSGLLRATSIDARNDVIVTTATIISVIFSKVTGITIDGWMGVAVSIFVIYSGFNIAKDTLLPLIGQGVEKEVYEKITNIVESYDGIIGSHDLIMHNYGPSQIMGTIHVEVPNSSNIEDVHRIIDKIERDALKDLGISLVIHADPMETKDKEIIKSKKVVEEVLRSLEPEAHIHDFRIFKEQDIINLMFDLVVPHEYKERDEEYLLINVEKHICEINEKYRCMITVEKSYISD